MYSVSVENEKGERIRLSQNPNYTITSITGLTPPTANINTAVNANFDGGTYKSSRMNTRNIVITMAIEGSVEANRIALYQFIKVKQAITLYFSNGTREVFIDGYVESLECSIFEKKEIAQVSILCPDPYFRDTTSINDSFSAVVGMFQFPFSIEEEGVVFSYLDLDTEVNVINGGDIETGMIIEFKANDEVVNPAVYKLPSNQFIKLNVTMQTGDTIRVNTNKGHKSVVKVSGGVTTNILNVLHPSSTWLTLDSGDNIMMYTADTGAANLTCSVLHDNLFEGV